MANRLKEQNPKSHRKWQRKTETIAKQNRESANSANVAKEMNASLDLDNNVPKTASRSKNTPSSELNETLSREPKRKFINTQQMIPKKEP